MKRLRISDPVSEQLVQLHYRNALVVSLPSLLVIGLCFLLLHDHVDEVALWTWTVCIVSVMALRLLLLRWMSESTVHSQQMRRRVIALASVAMGSAYSAVLIFFPAVEAFERAMLSAVLVGISAGVMRTSLGYRPLLLSFSLPIFSALAVSWFVNPGEAVDPTLARSVAFSLPIIGATLIIFGQGMFEALLKSIESQHQLEIQATRLSAALELAERAQSRAEASSESKTRFIAAASHDLRQPVHVLNLFLGALKQSGTSDRSKQIIDDMGMAVDSLSSQLNTLLDMSELDSGTVEPEFQTVELQALAVSLKREFDGLASDKGIELRTEIQGTVMVNSDPTMLVRVLRNLLGNAIKYTNEGSVRLVTSRLAERVELSIVDTGIGMNEVDRGKVFEEFYQVANPSRDKNHGCGLGLAIVERLVRSLGHTIALESTPGVGTRITLGLLASDAEMPRAPIQATLTDKPGTTSAATTRLGLSSTIDNKSLRPLAAGIHVHLVDDDDAVRRGMESCLRAHGCELTVTDSVASTLAMLRKRRPGVLLVDLRLRGGDSGLHVVDHVKQVDPELPLALITGESVASLSLAERYPDLITLQKPVPQSALIDLLNYLTEREAPVE